jgi:hypothetical protein
MHYMGLDIPIIRNTYLFMVGCPYPMHISFFFYSDTSEQGIVSEYNLILAGF